MNKFSKLSLAIFCVFAVTPGWSQVLTGKILDEKTREPVPFATVFFANTLTGTISKIDGSFELASFKPGNYDLVVSYVGYEDFVLTMDFEKEEEREIVIELKEDLVELPEFYLNADTAGRRYNMLSFKELVLGATENSQQTIIENPDAVFLYFDAEEKILYAHAKEPIVLDNQALGYRITYLLRDFRMNYKTGALYLFGIPAFEEKKPKNKRELNLWKKKREKAYKGSKTHFFKSLFADSLEEDLFVTTRLYRIPNPDRPSEEKISAGLRKWQKVFREELKKSKNMRISIGNDASLSSNGSTSGDSLNYWREMRDLPDYEDSLASSSSKGNELATKGNTTYKGLLHVQYTGEKEDEGYAIKQGRDFRDSKQTSVIHFLDFLTLYPNGHYEDVRNVFIEGYWSWSSSMAELLPLDYEPE